MSDQTSDPAQDAGLTSPPIQGVDEGVAISGDTVHVPITTPPAEEQQSESQTPTAEQPSEQAPPSDADQSAGGIITRPLTPPTAGYAETPVDQSGDTPPSTTEQPYPGTPTDATGDKSKDLA